MEGGKAAYHPRMSAAPCLTCEAPLTDEHLLAGQRVVCCPHCCLLQAPGGVRAAAVSRPRGVKVHEDEQGWSVRWWRADFRGVTPFLLGLSFLAVTGGVVWVLLRLDTRGGELALGLCIGLLLLTFGALGLYLTVKGLGALLDRVEVRATPERLTWCQGLLGFGRTQALEASELVRVEAVRVVIQSYKNTGDRQAIHEYGFDVQARSSTGAMHVVAHGLRSPEAALWLAEELAWHFQLGLRPSSSS